MNDKKLDCGYILKVEPTEVQMNSMWGVREIENSRKTHATKSCYLVGKAVGRRASVGKGQKHVEFEMCY